MTYTSMIRQAKLYDVPAIARIERETSSTPWSAESITHDITANDSVYIAVMEIFPAGENGEPEGPAVDKIGYADMWMVAGEAQLNNIAIDQKYRGHGLGRKLLEHMTDEALDRGCTEMTLEVRRSNETAISLYRKLGFIENGIRPRYYRDNHEDAVLMSMPLHRRDLEVEIDII